MKERSSGKGEARSTITSTVGGVMTKEAGAITGTLEVAMRPTGSEGVEIAVRYAGADEWYAVEGSPVELDDAGDLCRSELRELHGRVLEHLTRPGAVVDGNEKPASLRGISLR